MLSYDKIAAPILLGAARTARFMAAALTAIGMVMLIGGLGGRWWLSATSGSVEWQMRLTFVAAFGLIIGGNVGIQWFFARREFRRECQRFRSTYCGHCMYPTAELERCPECGR